MNRANEPDPATIRMTFRALKDAVPPNVRYRKLLKYALRSLGLRCTMIDNGDGQPLPPMEPAIDPLQSEPPF